MALTEAVDLQAAKLRELRSKMHELAQLFE